MSENLVNTIYPGIGSNLGNRRKNIELAKFKLTKPHKQRALLNAEMYSIEDAIAPGYLDEVTEHEKLMELALAKAKDLATLAHPQYQQTKKLDQEDVAAKISAGIDTLGAIN